MHFFFSLAAIAAGLTACNNMALELDQYGNQSDEIQFVTNSLSADVFTKATAVDVISLQAGFNVSCVKGSAGTDTEVWSNCFFEYNDVAGNWAGENTGKWWPLSDESYRFYAVFPSDYALSYAAGGPTISASNAHDIVVAYMSSPTYKAVNTLNFKHIFARLKNVTVTASAGYTLSDIDIKITPKTGGTYNLYAGAGQTDGTGWSSLTSGPATSIADVEPGTQVNDIYLVPGTYTLTASWTATKGAYSEEFAEKRVDVPLVAGKTSNIAVNLTGNAEELQLTVGVTEWADEAVDAGTFPVVEPLPAGAAKGKFTINSGGGQVYFSQGNLQYNAVADNWRFAASQYDYIGSANANVASDYDGYIDLFGWGTSGHVFVSDYGTAFQPWSSSTVDTEYGPAGATNIMGEFALGDWGIKNPISNGGNQPGLWRALTGNEWNYIKRDRHTGITVNGTADARFTQATINTDGQSKQGVLLFPDDYDGGTPDGVTWGTINSPSAWSTNATTAGWIALENAGCVFLPACGQREGNEMFRVGSGGYYWLATSMYGDKATVAQFRSEFIPDTMILERHWGNSVRLVQNVE